VHCRIPHKFLGRLRDEDVEVFTHAGTANAHALQEAAGDARPTEAEAMDDVA
jgi:hypothetical protein